jgi:hypothetical protein
MFVPFGVACQAKKSLKGSESVMPSRKSGSMKNTILKPSRKKLIGKIMSLQRIDINFQQGYEVREGTMAGQMEKTEIILNN